MEFLEIPLYDDDFLKLLVRFVINIGVVAFIVRFCYHQFQQSRSYVFTFLLMNVMVYFICFTLKKLDLGLGIALGLFAIFAIIRYRTDAIRVKEMTYLFIVIGVAVINSLSNKKTSYIELVFANVAIMGITFLLERGLHRERLSKQSVTYDNLELIQPNNRAKLLEDIRRRTGLDARRVKISKIDLQKGSASLVVFYPDGESDST